MPLTEIVVGDDGVSREVGLTAEQEAITNTRWASYVQRLVPTVSAAQAETALFDAGLYDAYVSAVTLHEYLPIRIWAAKANNWRRNHPYISALGAEIGLTEEQIDALFEAARKK